MMTSDCLPHQVRETSRKPDEMYDLLERLAPGTRKLELFGRPHNVHKGWTTLGNQLGKTRITEPWLREHLLREGVFAEEDLAPLPAATDPVYTSTVYKTNTDPARNADIAAGKTTLTWHFTGLSPNLDTAFATTKDRKTKRLRESIIRALADGGQTRVWNVMFDIVVQSGKFNAMASKLGDFLKEGETRLWVFLSVDRMTGEILDQQLEWVTD